MKIGTFVLIPNFTAQKGISKKIQPLRKGLYQIIDKPTNVTYKLTDSNKKEIVQHRNNLLPYYPKEYALRELTQLYSFRGLKIVQNNSENESNQHTDEQTNLKTKQQKELVHQTSPQQKTQTMFRNLFSRTDVFLFFVNFLTFFIITHLTKCKCIKKAIITFSLAIILLFLFTEEYWNKHKFSS